MAKSLTLAVKHLIGPSVEKTEQKLLLENLQHLVSICILTCSCGCGGGGSA